jgi:uncharacterized protein (DUF58 family)
MLILVLLQLIFPNKGWVILLVVLSGAWVIAYTWIKSLLNGLNILREMRFGWAQVGDQLEERFTLVNTAWVPTLWVKVIDHSDLPGYEVDVVRSVGGTSQFSWTKRGVCNRRGLFTLGPTSLETSDPFGLYSVYIHYQDSSTMMVTPPIIPLPSIQVATGGRVGEDRSRIYRRVRTVSASSVREYMHNEGMRFIHWPTSARKDDLYVRTFDSPQSSDWWIVLDVDKEVQVGDGQTGTEEHGIILGASLADKGLQIGKAVGLVTNGQNFVWLPPSVGDVQRWKILQSLALVKPGDRPLAELLERTRFTIGRRTSVVIITPSVDAQWVDGLMFLIQREIVPTVLLINPVTYGGESSNSRISSLLVSLGIQHYQFSPDLFDHPEAQPGKQGQWEWRVTPLGRAVLVGSPGKLAWKKLN